MRTCDFIQNSFLIFNFFQKNSSYPFGTHARFIQNDSKIFTRGSVLKRLEIDWKSDFRIV
uniref:Uncharacterized protein n=1 Tax=Leptospira santarosai serovar Arenal str. MAVJ 401 TaxID=1049976 RepID=M6JE07_9LEPT|nr:hypothetical protein LEP1GSC063_2464 [Leptospira santarosai serovar Arenal str. MAVJ 401]